MSMVRLGASRTMGLGWKSYDEQFRLRKTQNPSSIIDKELWLLYKNNTKTQFNNYTDHNSYASKKIFTITMLLIIMVLVISYPAFIVIHVPIVMEVILSFIAHLNLMRTVGKMSTR